MALLHHPPPHPSLARYILVSKMKQIPCSADWWLEWAILLLILRFLSAGKKNLFWSIIHKGKSLFNQSCSDRVGGWIMALFLSCLFVCLFAVVEQDEKTWPTHPAISVDLSLKSEKRPICCCSFFCLFVWFFLVKIIIVIIAVGIGGWVGGKRTRPNSSQHREQRELFFRSTSGIKSILYIHVEGDIGGTQYRNTVRKIGIGKYWNSVSAMDKISILHLWSVTLT